MESKWEKVHLSDVANLTVGFVGTMAQHYVDNGVTFLRSTNIEPFNINLDDVKYISPEFHQQIKKSQLEAGDVVIVRTGKPGASTVIPAIKDSWNCSDLVIVHPDQGKILPLYLASYINLAYGVINANLVGAVQQHFNVGSAKKLIIDLPPLSIQRQIVTIIQAIHDKIELNQKINENLERQAQAIFESRFTDGKRATGCLADICQYSKEKIAVSSLDLDSYYSTENMLPGKAGATQAASLPTTMQTTKCSVGDVLVSNIRPYFKKIVYCYSDCGCSTDVLCFVPQKQKLSAYLFFLLYEDSFFNFMVAGSKGTKMPRGDKQQIMMYPVYIPSNEELTAFNSVAQPVIKQIQLNREENKSLIALRDTLLPKLVAGEIDVRSINI